MATTSFKTEHEDMIHDAQLDYYGKALATASSDRTVKVFDRIGNPIATLDHQSPVWRVAWAHPKFGQLLASCCYDGTINVWQTGQGHQPWGTMYQDQSHKGSVNCVAWAPPEFGLQLAGASADGNISLLTYNENQKGWTREEYVAHVGGVNAISWASAQSDSTKNSGGGIMRFATGGCDNTVKIWCKPDADSPWAVETSLSQNGHTAWIRDVAWAPSVGMSSNVVASCSDDQKVILWAEQNRQWKATQIIEFEQMVWSVSWSLTGNILAVASGDNKVSLYKEFNGKWTKINEEANAM